VNQVQPVEKEIFIIRHGQTDYNKKGIVQGAKIDANLDEVGRKQAMQFYDFYQHIPFEIGMVSQLKRTEQTLFPFIESGLKILKVKELNEVNWGEYEGTSLGPKGKKAFKMLINHWKSGNLSAKLQDGESGLELQKRVEYFWNSLDNIPQQRILICSHGRTIRALLSQFLFGNLLHMESFHQWNTAVYLLKIKNQQRNIVMSHDLSHLSKDLIAKSK
jgi:broad specificity phosphatase PhoE